MTEIGISGAAGRMGRRVLALALADEAFAVKAAVEADGHEALGKDAARLVGVADTGVMVESRLARKVDVLLDFSSPAGTLKRLEECRRLGVAIVIGTTGLGKGEMEAVERVARTIPCLVSANMSLGVNLLTKLVAEAAAALGNSYDVEIIEAHHRMKKDAPSGTALLLARMIAESKGTTLDDVAVYGRCGHTGERPRGVMGIHAIRGGDIVGDHTVLFAGDGERIELVHRAHSRDTFAKGALRAAQFLAGKSPGFYTMDDVLGIK